MDKKTQKRIIIVVIAALVLFFGSPELLGVLPFLSISGVQVLGLSNVAILSNYNGLSGPWWIATAVLGGGQQLYVNGEAQGPGSSRIQTSSSTLASVNSSYNGSSQAQLISITLLKNQLWYPASVSSGAEFYQYQLEAAQNSGVQSTVTFTTCGGSSGTQVSVPSGQEYSFYNQCTLDGIVENPAPYVDAVNNYAHACASLGSSSQLDFMVVTSTGVVSGIQGGQPTVPYTAECDQYTATSKALLYELSSPRYNSTVGINVNGQSVELGSLTNTTVTTPNLIATYITSTAGSQQTPSETQVSVIQYLNSTPSTIVNYISSSELTGIQTGLYNYIRNQQFSNLTLGEAQSEIAQINGEQIGLAYQQSNSGQFNGATFSTSSINFFGINAPYKIDYVVINDPNGVYTRPEIQIAVKASLLGIFLGVGGLKVNNFTVQNFNSGGQGVADLKVTNNGTVAGGYTAQLINIPSGITISGGEEEQTINPGSSSNFQWTFGSSLTNTQSEIQNVGYRVCSTYSNQCVTGSASFTLGSICNTNQGYIYCNPQSHNVTNSTIQENGSVSGGSGGASNPPTCSSNQTLIYNSSTGKPYCQNNGDLVNLGLVILGILSLGEGIYLYFKKRRKHGK